MSNYRRIVRRLHQYVETAFLEGRQIFMMCKVEAHQRQDGRNPLVRQHIYARHICVRRHEDAYIEADSGLYHFRVLVLETAADRKRLGA